MQQTVSLSGVSGRAEHDPSTAEVGDGGLCRGGLCR